MAFRVWLAQREAGVGMAEFVMPRQTSREPSPPDAPVTYYSSSASINGSLFTEIF